MKDSQQETFMTEVLSNPERFSPRDIISAVAMGRWLNVSEIEALLNHHNNILNISTAPPSTPPASGALLLFNRSVTRNYKDDGHNWIKKKNSKKVREDHVKLKVGGKFRVSGCYVHSSHEKTFHRRAYHLLNPETGAALYPVANSAKVGNGCVPPSIILFHYLDTKISTANCASLVDKGIDLNPALYPSVAYSSNTTESRMGAITSNPSALMITDHTSSFPEHQSSMPHQIHQQTNLRLNHLGGQVRSMHLEPKADKISSFASTFMDSSTVGDPFMSSMEMSSDSLLENNAIDFLWDVVEEEGGGHERLHGSNLSELLTPEMIEKMFESEVVGNLTAVDLNNMRPSEMELVVESGCRKDITVEHSNETGNDVEKPSVTFGEEAVIPHIADITPDRVNLNNGAAKVVLSCTSNKPFTLESDGESFIWKEFAAFIEIGTDDLQVAKVVETKTLNPYCYQFQLHEGSLRSGSYRIMIIAVRLDTRVGLPKGINGGAVNDLLTAVFQANSFKTTLPSLYHSVTVGHGLEGRILTQLSEADFRVKSASSSLESVEHLDSSSMGTSMGSTGLIQNDLPAPPPAMALVATMLQDFPNPPPGAVLPPETTLSSSNADTDGITMKEVKEASKTLEEANTIISNAMEATVASSSRNDKKRSSSFLEVPRTAHVDDAVDAPPAANQWAHQTSSDPESDTKAEAVDRHCKIRFVERLTSVISETGGDSLVKDSLPQKVTTESSDKHGKCIGIDSEVVKALDDDELDHILDTLLVRIVESLVEMSPSECDIQEELNLPDRAGFTLLHYVST